MDLFRELEREPNIQHPAVWVSRIAIFGRSQPKATPIRDVHLTRGVNIVWAQEADQATSEAPITGHSAGKTTFCRLLRYCLGETTYGTSASTKAIATAFPEGQVAAELHVFGKRWAVMRPIGNGVYSRILPDATVEDLLQKRGRPVTQDSYVDAIGIGALMDRFPGSTIAKTGEEVEWDHILAWCTRDQEARFRNLHEWRSVRSESDAASFRFKKAGPMLVMRMALGLYESEELQAEEKLASLQGVHDEQMKALENAQREPEYLRRLHTDTLRGLLIDELPDVADITQRPLRSSDLEESMDRLAIRACADIDGRISRQEADIQAIKSDISTCDIEHGKIAHELEELGTADEFNAAAANAEQAGAAALEKLNKFLADSGTRACIHARVLFNECSEILKRKSDLMSGAMRDAHEQEQADARRAQFAESIRSSHAELEARLVVCMQRRDQLSQRLKPLELTLPALWSRRNTLTQALQNALESDDRVLKGGGTETLLRLKTDLTKTEEAQQTIVESLNKSILQHDGNRDLLARLFSSSVRSVLPASQYDGLVSFRDRALTFTVNHGTVMTGEAVETLSVLLADVSCLIYNALNKNSCLPGILVHDSPREADLALGIYHNFIRFVADQQHHFEAAELCPFQYILTTTTPPPEKLQGDDFVRLRLNASIESELLFRRNVAVTPEVELL